MTFMPCSSQKDASEQSDDLYGDAAESSSFSDLSFVNLFDPRETGRRPIRVGSQHKQHEQRQPHRRHLHNNNSRKVPSSLFQQRHAGSNKTPYSPSQDRLRKRLATKARLNTECRAIPKLVRQQSIVPDCYLTDEEVRNRRNLQLITESMESLDGLRSNL